MTNFFVVTIASHGLHVAPPKLDFTQAVTTVTQVPKVEGLGVFAAIDVQATINAKPGVDRRLHRIQGSYSAPMAHSGARQLSLPAAASESTQFDAWCRSEAFALAPANSCPQLHIGRKRHEPRYAAVDCRCRPDLGPRQELEPRDDQWARPSGRHPGRFAAHGALVITRPTPATRWSPVWGTQSEA